MTYEPKGFAASLREFRANIIYPAFLSAVGRGGPCSRGGMCLLWPRVRFPPNIYVFNSLALANAHDQRLGAFGGPACLYLVWCLRLLHL